MALGYPRAVRGTVAPIEGVRVMKRQPLDTNDIYWDYNHESVGIGRLLDAVVPLAIVALVVAHWAGWLF